MVTLGVEKPLNSASRLSAALDWVISSTEAQFDSEGMYSSKTITTKIDKPTQGRVNR